MLQHAQLATALSVIVGAVVPLVVAILTKENASSRVKSIVNAVLAAVVGGLTTVIHLGGSVSWETTVLDIGLAYAMSGTSYRSMWKPTGIAPALARRTARLG